MLAVQAGARVVEVAEEVGKKFGSGFDSMSVILTGSTPEEVIELSGKAAEGIEYDGEAANGRNG